MTTLLQEKLRMDLHTLNESVSELLKHGRKPGSSEDES